MAFDPFSLRPDSILHRLPCSAAQDTIDTVVEAAAPLDHGTPEQQTLRAAAAVELLEACHPADALQLMLSEHVATLHLGARHARRSAVGCMPGSAEEQRCRGTADRQCRTMLACLAALERRQAAAAATPAAATPETPSPPWPPEPRPPVQPPRGPVHAPVPDAQPELRPGADAVHAAPAGANDDDATTTAPPPDVAPDAAPATEAPPELLVRKLPRPARPAPPPLELPHWFWRPDGTRIDKPPQIWVDAHRLPDGTVPPWNRAAFDVMTMEERRAAWWYGKACEKAEADAIRLFGPGGPYEGQGYDWGFEPGTGIGGVRLEPSHGGTTP